MENQQMFFLNMPVNFSKKTDCRPLYKTVSIEVVNNSGKRIKSTGERTTQGTISSNALKRKKVKCARCGACIVLKYLSRHQNTNKCANTSDDKVEPAVIVESNESSGLFNCSIC
jgi:hypothetical protein